MFFLMRDLRRLNHMYQFSLATFLRLFRKALATDTPAGDTGARISLLVSTLLQVCALCVGVVWSPTALRIRSHCCPSCPTPTSNVPPTLGLRPYPSIHVSRQYPVQKLVNIDDPTLPPAAEAALPQHMHIHSLRSLWLSDPWRRS